MVYLMDNPLMQQDEKWMMYALELADKAAAMGEIPVGAVIVKEGKVIGEGWNQSIALHDPSAHAEMLAVRQAGQNQQNYRIIDSTLYVTLEPCSMCAGLLVHSRVSRVVYGATDLKTGAAGSVMNILQHAHLNHQIDVSGGVLGELCSSRLSEFFKARREEKKRLKKQKLEG
jgi:tRNA(adenine34) deaminase